MATTRSQAELDRLAAVTSEVLAYASTGLVREVDPEDILRGLVASYQPEELALAIIVILNGWEQGQPGSLVAYVEQLKLAALALSG